MPIVGGARFENSRDMQMRRYRSYRDTVGTEYILFCYQLAIIIDLFFIIIILEVNLAFHHQLS